MKSMSVLLAFVGAVSLAACSEPQVEDDYAPPPMEEPMAPAAEDQAAPVVAEAPAAPAAPTDSTTLPPEKRTSEQTVQPESETLFY